jgi:hypothetical protein
MSAARDMRVVAIAGATSIRQAPWSISHKNTERLPQVVTLDPIDTLDTIDSTGHVLKGPEEEP